MSDRLPAHLTDQQVDRITRYNDCNVDGGLAARLAREVRASRKLIADLRALHGPDALGACPACWKRYPCPTIRLIDGAGLRERGATNLDGAP